MRRNPIRFSTKQTRFRDWQAGTFAPQLKQLYLVVSFSNFEALYCWWCSRNSFCRPTGMTGWSPGGRHLHPHLHEHNSSLIWWWCKEQRQFLASHFLILLWKLPRRTLQAICSFQHTQKMDSFRQKLEWLTAYLTSKMHRCFFLSFFFSIV